MRLRAALIIGAALQAASLVTAPPAGLDLYMPVPESNQLTRDKIDLGQQLFFDRHLSRDETISCATCHSPGQAFSDGLAIARGVGGRQGRRNSPALVNRGYGRLFFWDGRARTLEELVTMPIADPNEMDLPLQEAASRTRLNIEVIANALASFVRSIRTGDSRFDRFMADERTALDESEQAGLRVFRTKGHCITCHIGPNFTDEKLHNTGVAWNPLTSSGQAAGQFTDLGAGHGDFKTPTLREVARTAPYMHDGSLAILEDVVDFYDRGGRPNPNLDPEIHPLGLSADEKRALLAFLRSLLGTISSGDP